MGTFDLKWLFKRAIVLTRQCEEKWATIGSRVGQAEFILQLRFTYFTYSQIGNFLLLSALRSINIAREYKLLYLCVCAKRWTVSSQSFFVRIIQITGFQWSPLHMKFIGMQSILCTCVKLTKMNLKLANSFWFDFLVHYQFGKHSDLQRYILCVVYY